jgi:transposase-like protein
MIRKRILRIGKKGKQEEEILQGIDEQESRIRMIQMLIPIGLKAVEEELQGEVEKLAGKRYRHGKAEHKRWGSNAGSVYLGDQKVPLRVPRVRNVVKGKEVRLKSYKGLQDPGVIDEAVFRRVINGISSRKYERAVMEVPETFGIEKSTISRRFIRASSKQLKQFMERDLSGQDVVAIIMDGKTFAEDEIITALGITSEGEKIVLGFIEAGTENHRVCRDFIEELTDRGLQIKDEILFVIDGSKGLYKAIKKAVGEQAIIQRCQWHKRENVVAYLNKHQQGYFRKKLQRAYEQPTYEQAKRMLLAIRKELKLINESAVKSLDEGFEETLTLHRLGLFPKLGISFKTTNCIENLHRLLGQYTDRICYWKTSNQRRRWIASAFLEIEPQLRKIKGKDYLNQLREAMKEMNKRDKQKKEGRAA